jgi:hypothetical protein
MGGGERFTSDGNLIDISPQYLDAYLIYIYCGAQDSMYNGATVPCDRFPQVMRARPAVAAPAGGSKAALP